MTDREELEIAVKALDSKKAKDKNGYYRMDEEALHSISPLRLFRA